MTCTEFQRMDTGYSLRQEQIYINKRASTALLKSVILFTCTYLVILLDCALKIYRVCKSQNFIPGPISLDTRQLC